LVRSILESTNPVKLTAFVPVVAACEASPGRNTVLPERLVFPVTYGSPTRRTPFDQSAERQSDRTKAAEHNRMAPGWQVDLSVTTI
jgi:hypothetical protein